MEIVDFTCIIKEIWPLKYSGHWTAPSTSLQDPVVVFMWLTLGGNTGMLLTYDDFDMGDSWTVLMANLLWMCLVLTLVKVLDELDLRISYRWALGRITAHNFQWARHLAQGRWWPSDGKWPWSVAFRTDLFAWIQTIDKEPIRRLNLFLSNLLKYRLQ